MGGSQASAKSRRAEQPLGGTTVSAAPGTGRGSENAQIKYENFQILTPVVEPGQSMNATVTLSNTGRLAGVEVVQLFVKAADSKGQQRRCTPRQLSQVRVNPSKTVIVDLSIPYECFKTVGMEANRDMSQRQLFEVAVGGISQDVKMLMSSVLVVQKSTPVTRGRKKPVAKTIESPRSTGIQMEPLSP